jgi:aspartyl/glutamyl-tRNA(Asn/Gln) amidotransferase C subunit
VSAREDVRSAAGLARLRVEGTEEECLAADLQRVLEAFHTLSEVDVSGVEEMTGPLDLERPPERPDEPRSGLARGELLARAPEPLDGEFFGVPRTVGGDA